MQILSAIILTVEFVLAFLLALYLLYKYSDIRRLNPIVTISTLIVWFLSFVIIFLLPVDVSSSFYRLCLDTNNGTVNTTVEDELCSTYYCEGSPPIINSSNYSMNCKLKNLSCFLPYTFVCKIPLEVLWYIIYWFFFFLSWIILPVVRSYVLAGYFSMWKKLLRALIENAVYYVTLGIIVVVLFVYLIFVQKVIALENLPYIIATASNTWGLLILAFLLGYGLVELPRSIFNASRHKYTLNHCYFKAAKLYIDMAESDENLQNVTERVKNLSQIIHYNDPLRKYLNMIIKKFPAETQETFSKGHDDFEDFKSSEDALTKKSLEKLFMKVTKAVRVANSTKIQWSSLAEQSLDLEDIDINRASSDRIFKSTIRSKSKMSNKFTLALEWYWKVWIRIWAYRVVAVMLLFLSVCIIWSEVLFSVVKPHLSIFAFLVYIGHQFGQYTAIEILSIVVVAYLSICAYFTVFKIRLFNLYYLSPHHNTDGDSLLFSAMLLSRLALPICLNYLYMIQVVRLKVNSDEDPVPQTSFALANGNTELIPWLTNYVYYLYPVLIVLICIATVFSIGSRISSLLGYQKFMGEDDFSADYIEEGKALIKRERRLREKSLRECGRVLVNQLQNERATEMQRERESGEKKLKRDRSRDWENFDEDDNSQIERLWNKAKGFASSRTVKLPSARYSPRRNDEEEDKVELLETEEDSFTTFNNDTANSNGFRKSFYPSSNNKGIFDDI